MTEMNNKIIQFNDFSFKEQRQVYVNMGSRIYREIDIYCPRLPHVWHSRKRKRNTKIELMDENEEMWEDDDDENEEVGDKEVVELTMATDVGESQKRRNRKKLLTKIKSYL